MDKIKVNIKFFAIVREKIGKEAISLELEANTKAEDLIKILIEKFPQVEDILKKSKISSNLSFVSKEYILKNNDKIAVIPPVSGG